MLCSRTHGEERVVSLGEEKAPLLSGEHSRVCGSVSRVQPVVLRPLAL